VATSDIHEELTSALQACEPAVFVDKTTRVICQGFTGKTGTFHSEQVMFHAMVLCNSHTFNSRQTNWWYSSSEATDLLFSSGLGSDVSRDEQITASQMDD
jgi:hypothetical protein